MIVNKKKIENKTETILKKKKLIKTLYSLAKKLQNTLDIKKSLKKKIYTATTSLDYFYFIQASKPKKNINLINLIKLSPSHFKKSFLFKKNTLNNSYLITTTKFLFLKKYKKILLTQKPFFFFEILKNIQSRKLKIKYTIKQISNFCIFTIFKIINNFKKNLYYFVLINKLKKRYKLTFLQKCIYIYKIKKKIFNKQLYTWLLYNILYINIKKKPLINFKKKPNYLNLKNQKIFLLKKKSYSSPSNFKQKTPYERHNFLFKKKEYLLQYKKWRIKKKKLKLKKKRKKLILFLKKIINKKNKKYNIKKLHKLGYNKIKKKFKLRNFSNSVYYFKKKLILKWLILNNRRIQNLTFWNFFFKKIIRFLKFKQIHKNKPLFYNKRLNLKLKKFFKQKNSFLKFKSKKLLILNLLNNFKLLNNTKNHLYLSFNKKLLIHKKTLKNLVLTAYKNNKFKYFFFKVIKILYLKKKYFKLKKKIFEKRILNLINKIFFPFIFKIFLKIKINKTKLSFFKYLFFNTYKHNFFKILNFLKKQYFLCFLYTIWYKNIDFLTFFFWNAFNVNNSNERFVLKNIKSFLRSILLIKYGILGIKIVLKGKLVKKPRKKKITFYRGSVQLLKMNNYIKFVAYDIFKRTGTFNFKCWISFLK